MIEIKRRLIQFNDACFRFGLPLDIVFLMIVCGVVTFNAPYMAQAFIRFAFSITPGEAIYSIGGLAFIILLYAKKRDWL